MRSSGTLATLALVTLGLSACAGQTDEHARAPLAHDPVYEAFTPAQQERIAAQQHLVERYAAEYGLEPSLVNAVIWVESRFQPDAKSPAGARGLMQLMPATAAELAKRLEVRRPRAHDPEFNIRAGTYYLARLRDRYEGDLTLALAAYNAGAGNVNKWMKSGEGLPDFSRSYVSKVMEAKARFEGTPVEAGPAPAPAPHPETETMIAETGLESARPAPNPYEKAREAEPETEPVPDEPPAQDPVLEEPDFEPVFIPLERPSTPEFRPTADPEPEVEEDAGPDVGAGILPGVGD